MSDIKRIMLLNPFNDKCIKTNNKDEFKKFNGHLYAEIPLGLSYIYTFLKKNLKHTELQLLDAHAMLIQNASKGMEYNWNLLIEKIGNFNPHLIGLGAYFLKSSELFHKTCKLIKSKFDNITIVAGGNYATIVPKIVLKDSNIDYILLSEGELSFLEFINKFYSNKNIETVDGIAFKKDDNTIFINPKKNYIKDLSILPIPDRSPFPMDVYGKGRCVLDRIYKSGSYNVQSLTVSRGCPYSCTFCTSTVFWKHRIKYRDTNSVLDEMQMLKEKYNTNVITINDDNFFFDKEKASEIMKGIIDRKLNIKWYAGGGSSIRALNDEEFLDLAVKSGLAFFNLAVESGSNETLKRIKKPVKIEETISLVEKIRRKYPNMWTSGFFIIGFPFETKKDIFETLSFSETLDIDWCCHYIFQPIPGSKLYDYCIEKNIIDESEYFGRGENFHKTSVYGSDWDSDWAFKINYEYNLRNNFINNRNIKRKNYSQALRDFEYIISLAPNHALAYKYAAYVLRKLGNTNKAVIYENKEDEIMKKENEFTYWYNKLLNKNLV